MDKSLAIHNLRAAGYSQRRIATTLGISRGAVRRHLAAEIPNGAKAQTAPDAEAQTPTGDPNSTKAQTGQPGDHDADLPAHTKPALVKAAPTSGSRCEYLGREVWVRYDSRLLRILDENLRVIATHTIVERGQFQTDRCHIASEKISPIERGIDHLLRKTQRIGPHSARWAETVVADRGVGAARVLHGVIALSRRHRGESIERACDIAWRSGAFTRCLRRA